MNPAADTLRTVRAAYDRRASWFDAFVRGASFGRDPIYRIAAIETLRLAAGMRVLDLGCGTGLNLPWLAPAVAPGGLVVGLDLSRPMLERARARASADAGLRLVQAEGGRMGLRPRSLDAVLTTYTLTTVPDWPRALAALVDALRPGGGIAILDDRLPPGWFVGPRFMLGMMRRQGWSDLATAVVRELQKSCRDIALRNLHGGLIYLIHARKTA